MMVIKESEFYNRLAELADRARLRDMITSTFFLTPADQMAAQTWLDKRKMSYLMHGGYEGAERKIILLLPDYLTPDQITISLLEDAIAAIQLKPKENDNQLTHRDYLGSLLGLGINRDQTGDILIGDGQATVLVCAKMAPLLLNELQSVGRQQVKAIRIDLSDLKAAVKNTEQIMVTASSLRLDKITAAGFSLSRSKASELIRMGGVQVDWQVCQHPDAEVKIGAVISLRGHGRVCLIRDEGLSRKNRHRLILERYL